MIFGRVVWDLATYLLHFSGGGLMCRFFRIYCDFAAKKSTTPRESLGCSHLGR